VALLRTCGRELLKTQVLRGALPCDMPWRVPPGEGNRFRFSRKDRLTRPPAFSLGPRFAGRRFEKVLGFSQGQRWDFVTPSWIGEPGYIRMQGRISLAPHPSMAEGRIPSTEDRAWGPANGKRPHRVCIMHTPCARFSGYEREFRRYPGLPFNVRYQVPGSRCRVLVPGTGYPVPDLDRRRGPDTEHRGRTPVAGQDVLLEPSGLFEGQDLVQAVDEAVENVL
jgi:hypothetical protein